MIRKLKYSEIDFEKYSRCIENSVQRNFYAQKDILDHLCETWELLVLNDYEAVMPVPIKKKYGLKVVLMPLFCQQLGIFSKEVNSKKEQQFVDFFQKEYNVMYYAFNTNNSFSDKFQIRKNYEIMPQKYADLRKKYFKGRKSTVKSAQKHIFKEEHLSELLFSYISANFKGLSKKEDQQKFLNYISYLDKKDLLTMFSAKLGGEITSLAILIDGMSSFYLLGLVNSKTSKSENGASFVIDHILQQYSSSRTFDFMGGSIRGIEIFFKSFGAELQEFPVIENGKADLFKNLFRRR